MHIEKTSEAGVSRRVVKSDVSISGIKKFIQLHYENTQNTHKTQPQCARTLAHHQGLTKQCDTCSILCVFVFIWIIL